MKYKVVMDCYPKTLNQETSQGIFAPWAIYKEDFTSIGGHDPLYAPQIKRRF